MANFKPLSLEELRHGYLWRVHQRVPGDGGLMVFNRSHYADVLAVRVLKLVPRKMWQRKYEHINGFEKMISDEGTLILKFYLHIDKAKQRKRLRARLLDPSKHWKFDRSDLEPRKLWPAYTSAYEDVLSKTSTSAAPWYVVPANKKWFRNVVVGTVLVDALEAFSMRYPEPQEQFVGIEID